MGCHKKYGIGSIVLGFKGKVTHLFDPELSALGKDPIFSTECTERTVIRTGGKVKPDLGMDLSLPP